MNTLFTQVRKSIALLTIGALLSTMVVVSTASAEWYDSAVARLGDASYATMGAAEKNAALTATTSRQDAAVILHRALGGEAATITELTFTDKAAVAPYAVPAVLALVEAGVIKGNPDGSFRPTAGLNRAEFAVMLERAGVLGDELAPTTPAVDAEFAGLDWAKAAFQKAAAAGIIQGYPDGTWRPAGPVNKAEAFVLSDRATGGSTEMPEDEGDDEEDDYSSPLQGTAGDIDSLDTTSAGTEDEVQENKEDVAVFAFDIEAEGSDLALQSFKLEFQNTDAGDSSERFERYAEEVSVWQGSREIGRESVDEFTDNNVSGEKDVYSRSISLEDAVVREDAKVRFFVAITSASVIDSGDFAADWEVELTQVRYEDATGALLTDGFTGKVADFTFEDLASSGDLELKVRKGANNPAAQGVEVSETSNTKVLLNEFTLTAQGSDIVIDSLPVTATAVGANLNVVADELTLELEGDELDNVPTTAALSATYTFTDLEDELEIADGETVTLQVYADMNELDGTAFANGDTLKVELSSANRNAIDAEDENGDDVPEDDRTGTSIGEVQTFYTDGIVVEKVSENVSVTTVQGSSDVGTYTYKFKVTAFGENAYIDKDAVRRASLAATTAEEIAFQVNMNPDAAGTSTITGTLTSTADDSAGELFEVEEGETEEFTLQVVVTPAAGGTLNYSTEVRLLSIGFANADADTEGETTYTSDLDKMFRTTQVLVDRAS